MLENAYLVFLNDGAVIWVWAVVDDSYIGVSGKVLSRRIWQHLPPFGPVEEIVVKDNPRNRFNSLYKPVGIRTIYGR